MNAKSKGPCFKPRKNDFLNWMDVSQRIEPWQPSVLMALLVKGERERTPNESEQRTMIELIIFEISDVGAAFGEGCRSRASNLFVTFVTDGESDSLMGTWWTLTTSLALVLLLHVKPRYPGERVGTMVLPLRRCGLSARQ